MSVKAFENCKLCAAKLLRLGVPPAASLCSHAHPGLPSSAMRRLPMPLLTTIRGVHSLVPSAPRKGFRRVLFISTFLFAAAAAACAQS